VKDPISCPGKPAVIGVAPSEEIRKKFHRLNKPFPSFKLSRNNTNKESTLLLPLLLGIGL